MTDDLPTHCFAPAELDGPKPFASWQPSPEQIARWCVQIRHEAGYIRDGEQTNAQEARCGAAISADDESIVQASHRVSGPLMRRGDV